MPSLSLAGPAELLWVMWETPVLLLSLGTLSALVGFIINTALHHVAQSRIYLVAISSDMWESFGVFAAFSFVSAALANFITQARAALQGLHP
jgi:hypothetical protein